MPLSLFFYLSKTMLQTFQQHTPNCGQKVYCHEHASVIGEVKLGDDVSVWPQAVIRGDVNHITVGDRTNVQDSAVLHVTHVNPQSPQGFPLIIENDVTIGHHAMLHGCHVKAFSLIGIGATILDGAVVESHVLLGAGSLVTPGKVLTSGYLWMGSPAKKIRPLTEEEIAHFAYSAEHYVKLKDQYLAEQSL